MSEAPHRWDSWAQWVGMLLLVVGALWNLAGRLSRIEQQLSDDAAFHASEVQRLEFIEREVLPYLKQSRE